MSDGGVLKVLSLGAGVQSSCLLLMAHHGEIERPGCVIFADTQAETQATYEYLNWLESVVTIPIHRKTKGNLEDNVLRAVGSSNWRLAQPLPQRIAPITHPEPASKAFLLEYAKLI